MELMTLGGPLMWALLAVSIAVLAIIVERWLVLSRYKVPKGLTAVSTVEDVRAALRGVEALSEFAAAVDMPRASEGRLVLAGEAVVAKMEERLGVLATLARAATLLGLLGTILGMIDTFSVVAATTSGIDMTLLADGLWQALITTAAGLVIAIPAFLAYAWFAGCCRQMSAFLSLAANIAAEGRSASAPGGDHDPH